MSHLFSRLARRGRRLLAGLLLAAPVARAQTTLPAPAWGGATAAVGSDCFITAAAADAAGNVFVVGYFSGTATFGTTALTAAATDLFVAKYVPATNTWAWAQRGGGTSGDGAYGVAVQGSSVYVTGSIINNDRNQQDVRLGGTSLANSPVVVRGVTDRVNPDLLLVKYQDNGSSASVVWTQVAGGFEIDGGYGVAVQGSSVYVTGLLYNNQGNGYQVVFGGNGTTAGTSPQYGASSVQGSRDLLLAKYQDNGSTASYVWSQVGGGNDSDYGYAVAVSGSNVYVTGSLTNNLVNDQRAVFGGSGPVIGTVQVNGIGSALYGREIVLAKYVDQGSSATLGWTQVAGGQGPDYAGGLAVSGSSVYLAGIVTNNQANTNQVVFGGGGTTPGTVPVNGASTTTSYDLVLAKYVDAGTSASVAWTQVAGGRGADVGNQLVVSGSSLYVAGGTTNDAANTNGVVFGGGGTTAGTVAVSGASATVSSDLLLARYTDNGASATYDWSRVGGSADYDLGAGLVLSGQRVLVYGYATAPATFGPTTLTGTSGSCLVYLTDPALPLAARPPAAGAGLVLAPNPAGAGSAATLAGAAPGAAVQVLDALGRPVATATADAAGAARLPGGLAPGLYLVRAGAATARLAVE